MSRKGKMPIPVPSGVEVKVDGNKVTVKGSKGTLNQEFKTCVSVVVENQQVIVSAVEDDIKISKFHGLYRTLIDNMVTGVTKGFEKKLQMIGVGYRAAVKGQDLDLQVGFSHPSALPIPQGIEVKVDKGTEITIGGCDKQLVGQFAADIRRVRPPEPYKGKGIRYVDEYVRRKAGKSAAK